MPDNFLRFAWQATIAQFVDKVHICKFALRLTKESQIKERSETKPVNVAIEVSANR